jgi:hypothetical protein
MCQVKEMCMSLYCLGCRNSSTLKGGITKNKQPHILSATVRFQLSKTSLPGLHFMKPSDYKQPPSGKKH